MALLIKPQSTPSSVQGLIPEMVDAERSHSIAATVCYIAATLFSTSCLASILCYWNNEVDIIVKLPCYISLPLTTIFFIYALSDLKNYQLSINVTISTPQKNSKDIKYLF